MLSTVSAIPLSEKEMKKLFVLGSVKELELEPQTRGGDSGNRPKWLYSKNQYENTELRQNFQVEIATSPMLEHEQFRSQLLVAARGTRVSKVDFTEPPSAEESPGMFIEYQDDMQAEEKKVYLQLKFLNDEAFRSAHQIEFLFGLSNLTEETEIPTNPTAITREKFPIKPEGGEGSPVHHDGIVFRCKCHAIDVTVKLIGTQPLHSSVGARLEWMNGAKLESDPRLKVKEDPTYDVQKEWTRRRPTLDGEDHEHRLYIKTEGKPIFTFGGSFYADPTN